MKKNLGVIGLLIVAIIWGSGFIAANKALETMSPLQILCIRFFIAAILMSLVTFRKLKKVDKKVLRAGIILGVLLFMAFATQTIGLKYTTPSKNAFLTSTNVVIVPFIAFVIYKKKVDRFSVVGAILALIGIGILSLNGNLTLGFGDGLTLICAICFAFQIFFTGEFVKEYDVMTLTALQMIVAFLLSIVVILFVEDIHFQVSRFGLLSVIYLGVFSTTVAFLLQTISQKYTDETKAALVLSLESIFGTLFSILLVHEKITARMTIGCMLILGAVIIAETKLKWLFKTK